ncbi:CYTH domain-containing protein [Thalassobacillus sp. CUG 92003]|uniref:CYTH domain-containing protein n=1 Tax=Thalassobacillus sp. CUG 92003 TaxID=2736641 RepID=UPI0015E7338C|nr:CYTH domain-containing protein [Thalassobacillus sp. CUG 92003]
MAQEIEIEFKNLLTKDEYQTLHQSLEFENATTIKQTNYYFETDMLSLRNHGSALRIREKNGSWVLTLKQPHPEGLLETHDELTDSEAQRWINSDPVSKPNVEAQLKQIGLSSSQFHCLGNLTTIRKEINYKNTTLVLDYSMYHQTEDYELELESSSKSHGKDVFFTVLNSFHIPERVTPNKIKRFYDARPQSD